MARQLETIIYETTKHIGCFFVVIVKTKSERKKVKRLIDAKALQKMLLWSQKLANFQKFVARTIFY